jgi:multisubunit Na+/H+ antiporter MnhG subunit
VFLFFTSPIATHAVAQVAHKMGVKPVGRNLVKATPTKTAKPKKSNAKTAKGKS